MEAMSARCLVVAPEYSALPETLANFNVSYGWTENMNDHAKRFSIALEKAILSINAKETEILLDEQKHYADKFYNWETRKVQWEQYLLDLTSNIGSFTMSGKRGLQWN